MRYEHFYFKYEDKYYNDYTLFTYNKLSLDNADYTMLMCDQYTHDLCNEGFFNLLDKTFTPNENDPIHVVPVCKVPMDDIRNHYKVKRKPDAGVCNVFSPIRRGVGGCRYVTSFNFMVLCESKKSIFLSNFNIYGNKTTKADFWDTARVVDPKVFNDRSSCIIEGGRNSSFCLTMYSLSNAETYKDLIDGKLKKPCIHIDNLPIRNQNKLTQDFLEILYTTGSKSWYYDTDIKSFGTQIAALNQTDWRNYPGTLNILFTEMLSRKVGGGYFMQSNSCLPKYAREMYRHIIPNAGHDIQFASEDDFKMALEFINNKLNINGKRFASLDDVLKKLEEVSISQFTFNRLYNNIIKIEPREYEEEGN